MKIGIIVAMDKELQQLKQVFGHASNSNEVIIQKCGIGKVNAALGAAQMIRDHRPDVIISSGCAGGNGDDIHVQDVVVSTELVYHDVYCGRAIDDTTIYGQVQGLPARYQAGEQLLQAARTLAAQPGIFEGKMHFGLIATGDWFVDAKQKMRSIVELFPEAKAVDMESAAIAQTCYKAGVPFISFRVISDMPLKDTDASMYHDFWDRIAQSSFTINRKLVEILFAQAEQAEKNEPAAMEKIPSFTIDHNRLLRGIYVSRKDQVGGEVVTTFDIRMKEPNREPALHIGALHTIEHLAATYLRNNPEWKDRILYWGPMGCLTGCYLLLRGDYESSDIADLMRNTFSFIANYQGDIPGAAPRDCGNYLLHDLPMARLEARRYLEEVLQNITPDNLQYPQG